MVLGGELLAEAKRWALGTLDTKDIHWESARATIIEVLADHPEKVWLPEELAVHQKMKETNLSFLHLRHLIGELVMHGEIEKVEAGKVKHKVLV